MASPLGHAVVGVATAAVVARSMDTSPTTAFWLIAIVASGLPDLDLLLGWFGRHGPKYHRNGSHSLFVIAAAVGGAWLLTHAFLSTLPNGLFWGWAGALFSHPILDVLTTGPKLAERGYGIGLLWPLSGRRFFVNRPIVNTPELDGCHSVREIIAGVAPEAVRLGPPSLLILVATVLF